MKNKLPQMGGDVGYGLGFFCGCLVGAVGTYFAFTPDGKKLKDKIIKEYRANQQTLALQTLIPSPASDNNAKLVSSIQKTISQLKQVFAPKTDQKSIHPIQPKPVVAKKKHFLKKK